jgi:hypothetical protein
MQLRGVFQSGWLFGFQNLMNIDDELRYQLYYDLLRAPDRLRSRDRQAATANEVQLCVREYAQITHDSLLGLAKRVSRPSQTALRAFAR